MKAKIKLSDIHIILKLFVRGEIDAYYFDPLGLIENDQEVPIKKIDGAKRNKMVLVTSSPSVKYYKSLNLDDFDCILSLNGALQNKSTWDEKKLSSIKNTDGTIRWIFPSSSKKPLFLSLFNPNNTSSIWKARLIKWMYRLRLNFLLTTIDFRLYSYNHSSVDFMVEETQSNDYAIFTGTPGLTRKAVVALDTKKQGIQFYKIPLTTVAKQYIKNEVKFVQYLNRKSLKNSIVPNTTRYCSNNFTFRDVTPSRFSQNNELGEIHVKAISEWYSKSVIYKKLGWTRVFEVIRENLFQLNNHVNPKWQPIVQKLEKLQGSLNRSSYVSLGISHGDLTPWNSYVNEDKLYVYDWEIGRKDAPLLFDVFHFIFQKEILVRRSNYKEIVSKISNLMDKPYMKNLVNQYNINVQLHLQLYLLMVVSYYLRLYSKQTKLHEQVSWLIQVWNEAVEDQILMNIEPSVARQEFIYSFNKALKRTPHAFLKLTERNLANISENADLDLLVLKDDVRSMVTFCKKHHLVRTVRKSSFSFMTNLRIEFVNNDFLSIDLIHEFRRKNLFMCDSMPFLKSSVLNRNEVSVPEVRFDLEYVLSFYTINNASIPDKYIRFFMAQSRETRTKMEAYLTHKYHLPNVKLEEILNHNLQWRSHLLAQIQELSANKGFKFLKRTFQYLFDTLKVALKDKGMVVTFSGVDGAGKSTIIEHVSSLLSQKLRKKMVVLRHRPSLLPILSSFKYGREKAEEIAAKNLPRKGNNHSKLSSIIRFAYYYTDYLVGQFYVYVKYVLRGYVVIYDRYYFDFINDAKRSNIIISPNMVRALYKLIFKPKLNIFLYESSEVILQRKQELTKEAIEHLNQSYIHLFDDFNLKYKHSKYVSIRNRRKDKTVHQFLREFKSVA